MTNKNNCYSCVYRAIVPGSAHSMCRHPEGCGDDDYFTAMLNSLEPNKNATIIVTAHAHGVRSGWFNWPFDFDPVWMTKCTGFKEKSIE